MKSLSKKDIHEYMLDLDATKLEFPFGEEAAVYKVDVNRHKDLDEDFKMFAIIREGKEPVQLSLKCDPQLSETLREKYESVMPGYHLNKKHWNTIICSGQLETQEVQDLIDHSYALVAGIDTQV